MTRETALRRTVTIAPLALAQVGAVVALARKFWRAHYPGIIVPRR